MKAGTSDQSTITVHVPMTFAVRGGRKTVISQFTTPQPQPRIDDALFKALARAHSWRRKIESGQYASITELAKAEGVNQSYACRLLRLTLLAPAITATILNRRLNADLTLNQLLKPLSDHWDEQLAVFNIRPGHKLD